MIIVKWISLDFLSLSIVVVSLARSIVVLSLNVSMGLHLVFNLWSLHAHAQHVFSLTPSLTLSLACSCRCAVSENTVRIGYEKRDVTLSNFHYVANKSIFCMIQEIQFEVEEEEEGGRDRFNCRSLNLYTNCGEWGWKWINFSAQLS